MLSTFRRPFSGIETRPLLEFISIHISPRLAPYAMMLVRSSTNFSKLCFAESFSASGVYVYKLQNAALGKDLFSGLFLKFTSKIDKTTKHRLEFVM